MKVEEAVLVASITLLIVLFTNGTDSDKDLHDVIIERVSDD